MQIKTCSKCTELLHCGSSDGSCWCMAYPSIPIADAEMDCLCPTCLAIALKQNESNVDAIQQDYYIENGMCVFTKFYHLKRGYCCQNGCRHCPYGFKR
ncbi:DUF5522 domain-containing protein [uncultured Cytophaga sp.]|uniref:DUF5522 domain-containing protein n=1 Tax=uncultured Cytophaga sp. TaxID=160238 RepID=UPI0026117B3D|nr:DUF5522 domain-containing protein [uncultured Cytophaga sp.]